MSGDRFFQAIVVVTVVTVVLPLGFVAAAGVGFGIPVGDSSYTGYVVDTEDDTGLVWKTSQAHLKTHPRSSTHETFCIPPGEEQAQLNTLQAALQNGSRVRVTYSRPLFVAPWDCEPSTTVIRNVTVVNSS